MAGNTISITFKLEGDDKTFKDLTKDADALKNAMNGVISEAGQLKGSVINFAALATGIDAAQRSFGQLQGAMQSLADTYAVQETAERKLETVMRQRMGATDEEIQSIKDLASAQQEIGVIGDEVQLSGAQQVATFLNEKSSIETLLPAMNNLLAQQKGLNATTGDAVSVANLMGKVMQGQTSALTRVGITFTEAQEKVLKYGTESERAAMLAQVITDNVGEMNQELAQTDSGKQQQLANTIGDLKEKLGSLITGAMPFVTIAAESTKALASITTLVGGVKLLTTTMYASAKAFAVSTAAFIKNKVATLAVSAAQKVVTAATTVWTGVQKILNLVLTANPIGLIITAIGALVAAIIYAYNNCEAFRKIVDAVWASIKPLATAIMNGLAKAFEWLVEKAKAAWEWLKKILGLGGKTVEVAVDVSKPTKSNAPAMDLGEVEKKYANYDPKAGSKGGKGGSGSGGSGKANPVWNEKAETLEAIEGNLDILNAKLKKASADEAVEINKQIKLWEQKADAIKNAGATDNSDLWKEDAANLRDINKNIEILQERLETASVEEAATINQQIAAWEKKADAIKNAGKEAEKTGPIWKENASTIKEISDNVKILQDRLENANATEAAALNQQIDLWNKKADAIKNAGKTPVFNGAASNLKDINDNIQILQDRLQTASVQEAAAINQEIALWNKKAEAIKKAGIEAETAGQRNYKAFTTSWGAAKSLGSSIQGITDALKGNGNAWQIVCGLIDGFIGLYEGIQTIVGVINLLTGASAAHAATKGVEAASETTEAATRATAAGVNAEAAAAVIVANKLEAASWKELAASEYMAAHAYIPFAGFGIAMGFTAAMLAATTAAGIPALADGGIASGPTLALVGEYAGASGNPEIIAPLDKLKGYLADAGGGFAGGQVEFVIKGRNLVGILAKENNITRRS